MTDISDRDEAAERQSAENLVPEKDGRLAGWGGNEGPALSPEQLSRLQEHDEPDAAGDLGGLLHGDLGRAEVAGESVDAPETEVPDTSLGHEGGKRYEDFGAGAGEQA